MLSLNTIKLKNSSKKRKRVGRGNASGSGNYSGKGMKGQKSRSGVSTLRLKKIGMKHGRSALRGIPKLRGFKSDKPKNQVIKISEINTNFKDSDTIDTKVLVKKGLIAKANLPVKLLNDGELKLKKLFFKDIKVSKSVQEQLEKTGCKAI